MIKFYKEANLAGSDLLLSFSGAGLSGTFAASLLAGNQQFEHVGLFFSHNISPIVRSDIYTSKPIYNGEVYFNQEKKITLIDFTLGAGKKIRSKFFEELTDLYKKHSMNRIIIIGGIAKEYLTDTELKKESIDVYYLANEVLSNDSNVGIINFEKYISLDNKTKPLKELDYMSMAGTPRYLVKYLNKNGINFIYLFAYSSIPIDPLAGYAIYNRVSRLLGLGGEIVILSKKYDFKNFIEEHKELINLDSTWRSYFNTK
jgi:predicted ATP-grasp superfamily ATP-dependent carboligase